MYDLREIRRRLYRLVMYSLGRWRNTMCRSLTTAVLSLCFPEWFFGVLLQLLVLINWYLIMSQEEHCVEMFLSKGNTEAWTRRSVGMSTMPPVAFVPLYDVRLSAGTRDTHTTFMYETRGLELSIKLSGSPTSE